MNQAKPEAPPMVLTLIQPARAYELRAIRVSETCVNQDCPVKASIHHHAVGPDGRPYAVSGA